ncbi:MAG TPA: carbohydrate-binding protein, partial [Flavisolibacter sp.]|nr:carbohydrate-binding protein [Flavisolibacter sp.]
MRIVKYLLLPVSLLFLFCITTLLATAQQGVLTKRPNVSINPNVNGFLEYVPFGYNTTTERFPLILYINGIGSTGNGSESALENHFTGGGYPHEQQRDGSWVDAYIVNGQTFRFLIITPQFITPMNEKIPTAAEVNDVINYAINHYRVDTSRIYVMGQSQGGGAVWDYPGTSSAYARRIAAIVPFSGVSYPIEAKANNIKYNNVAVWAFHNFFDAQVPVYFTEDYVDMINHAPSPAFRAKKTVSVAYQPDGTPNPEHNSWYRWLRREVTDNGTDIYEWMLQFKTRPSTAFAGLFQEITLPLNSIQLNGGGTGPNGTAVAYNWQKISGPSGVSISNSAAATTTASGMITGAYTYQLTVTDNAGGTALSNVNVLVNPASERIQAENYSNMLGVRTENTDDVGGGVHVGYIDQGDWMEYPINVPAAGNYKLRFRFGSFISGGKFRVLTSSGTPLDTIDVFDTGGWQRFLTRTITLPLVAGPQTIRFESIASAGWNFNWFEVESASLGIPINLAPSAQAGADLAIRHPVNSAQLNG